MQADYLDTLIDRQNQATRLHDRLESYLLQI